MINANPLLCDLIVGILNVVLRPRFPGCVSIGCRSAIVRSRDGDVYISEA
jgi:hypothetical protein